MHPLTNKGSGGNAGISEMTGKKSQVFNLIEVFDISNTSEFLIVVFVISDTSKFLIVVFVIVLSLDQRCLINVA